MGMKRRRGPTVELFDRRYRKGGLEPHGVYPSPDAGTIPPTHFLTLVNGRVRSNQVVPRGGLTSFASLASGLGTGAEISGGHDFQLGTPLRAYIVGDGCPGISTSVGFNVGFCDTEQSTFYQSAVYYDYATQGTVLASYNGDLYIGQDNRLRRLQTINIPYGATALDISGSSLDIPLKTFTGFTKIVWMENFDGRLYIALNGGAGASKIVAWDGLSFTDDLTAIDPPGGMFRWRDKLILGYINGPNHIRVRDAGTPPGTWGTVVPAAGTVDLYKTGTSLHGTAYFPSNATFIWSYDGTTLQKAHTVAAATFSSVTNFNDLLYYGDSATAHNGKVGMFDGSVWNDAHVQLGTISLGASSIRALGSYRGNLMILSVVVGGTASGGRIYRSLLTDTPTLANYTITNPGSGDLDQILVA